jgi:ribosomal protein L7/L12
MQPIKTEYNVVLVSYADRMEAIRKLMQMKRWGMKEAKDYLEQLPSMFCEGMDMYDALKICEELEKIGCTTRIE